MKEAHAQTLIAAGVVEDVVVLRVEDGWEVWIHGENIPPDLGNRVRHTRRDAVRVWAHLDTAVSWVRKMGWKDRIGVEG